MIDALLLLLGVVLIALAVDVVVLVAFVRGRWR
jgi:hypothetical protein